MRSVAFTTGLAVLLTTASLAPGSVEAKGPKPASMTASACRASSSLVRVSVTWSDLYVTGGEFFVNILPLETGYTHAWNWPGRPNRGTYTIDMNVGSDIADFVTVNLYNAKRNPITFEQRIVGESNSAEELPSCST